VTRKTNFYSGEKPEKWLKEIKFAWLFVEQEKFNKYRPNSFEDLIKTFAK